jgi:peptidoglycan/xylan/chitin deacetylase (PgdA/CDA1 family)
MRRIISIILACFFLSFGVVQAQAARIVYSFAGSTARPRVALTFDDGPHPRYTPEILDILKEQSLLP